MQYKDPEKKRAYMREYRQRPEVKERNRECMREYNQRPEVKERNREYQRKRREALKAAKKEEQQ